MINPNTERRFFLKPSDEGLTQMDPIPIERLMIDRSIDKSLEEAYGVRLHEIFTSAIQRYVSEISPPTVRSIDGVLQTIALREAIRYVTPEKSSLPYIIDPLLRADLDEYKESERKRYIKDVLPRARFIRSNYLSDCFDSDLIKSDLHQPLRRFNGRTLREVLEYMHKLNNEDKLNRDTVLEIFTIPPAVITTSNLTEESSYEVFGNKNLLDMIVQCLYPDDIARLSMSSRFFWTSLKTRLKEYTELAAKLNKNGWKYRCYIRESLAYVNRHYSPIKDINLWACTDLRDYRCRSMRELLSTNDIDVSPGMIRTYMGEMNGCRRIPLPLCRELLEDDIATSGFMKAFGKDLFHRLFDVPEHQMNKIRDTVKTWPTEKISDMLNDKAFLRGLKLYHGGKLHSVIGLMYRLAPECAKNPKIVELTSSFGYYFPKQKGV